MVPSQPTASTTRFITCCIGHWRGERVACALAIRNGMIPPTANYEVPDPRCDLDYVPYRARRRQSNTALMNVRGLGGGNSSLVVQRLNE